MLRTQALGEADLIVSLVGARHGRIRGVARSARKSRKRFGGVLEPMTRVRAAWTEKHGRQLHAIDSLDPVRSFASMQSEPSRQAACAVLCELCEAFAQEGQSDDKGFKLLGAVLEALEVGTQVFIALRYFEYWTLRLHGLMPDLDACGVCGEPLEGSKTRVGRHSGLRCRRCDALSEDRGFRWTSRERGFMESARVHAPRELQTERRIVGPGGALEALLVGRLEAFAERSFRTYRHLRAAARFESAGDGR